MSHIAYMAGAVLIGALIAMQPPLNAMLARALGTPIGAATVSIAIALACAALLLAATWRTGVRPQALLGVPWWVYFSGVIGAIFVAGGVVIAPVTGALLFFVCVVAGQLLGAMAIDGFGAFGLDVRAVTPARLAGLVLVVAGAALVNYG